MDFEHWAWESGSPEVNHHRVHCRPCRSAIWGVEGSGTPRVAMTAILDDCRHLAHSSCRLYCVAAFATQNLRTSLRLAVWQTAFAPFHEFGLFLEL